MITRTVKYTEVTYAILKEDLTVEKITVKIPGKNDEKTALKYIKKNIDVNAVKVISLKSADVLTAMSEETWLKYCQVVTDRYVKVADR